MSEMDTPFLRFSISSAFGHFRTPYATSYLETYLFPPKPTIIGLIGAIFGWDEDMVLNEQNNVNVGIKLQKIPRKFTDYMVIKKFEGGGIKDAPLRMEILVNPVYDVYLHHRDHNTLENIKMKLKDRDFSFPIYMGKNEFLIEKIEVDDCFIMGKKEKISQPRTLIFWDEILPTFKLLNEKEVYSKKLSLPFYLIGVPTILGKNNGSRTLIKTSKVLVITNDIKIKLDEPIDGYLLENGEEICII